MPVLLAPNARMTETKLVAGEVVLDRENPTILDTGLRAVVAVTLSLRSSPAPELGTAS